MIRLVDLEPLDADITQTRGNSKTNATEEEEIPPDILSNKYLEMHTKKCYQVAKLSRRRCIRTNHMEPS